MAGGEPSGDPHSRTASNLTAQRSLTLADVYITSHRQRCVLELHRRSKRCDEWWHHVAAILRVPAGGVQLIEIRSRRAGRTAATKTNTGQQDSGVSVICASMCSMRRRRRFAISCRDWAVEPVPRKNRISALFPGPVQAPGDDGTGRSGSSRQRLRNHHPGGSGGRRALDFLGRPGASVRLVDISILDTRKAGLSRRVGATIARGGQGPGSIQSCARDGSSHVARIR